MFEANKEYKTRDGRRARIYAVECDNQHSIHGAVLSSSGQWLLHIWSSSGRVENAIESNNDLVLSW